MAGFSFSTGTLRNMQRGFANPGVLPITIPDTKKLNERASILTQCSD